MQLVCSRLIIFFVLGQKTRTCTARLTRLGDNYKQIPYIPEKYGYVLSCDVHHYLSLGGDPTPLSQNTGIVISQRVEGGDQT